MCLNTPFILFALLAIQYPMTSPDIQERQKLCVEITGLNSTSGMSQCRSKTTQGVWWDCIKTELT